MKRVLKLELSAQRKKALLINAMVPAFILFFTGIDTLIGGSNTVLGILNIVSGAALILVGIREWRSLRAPAHHRIQWYDVLTGVVMMIDAVMMYKSSKVFQPAWFYAVASVIVMLKGFAIINPTGIHRLTISEHGFAIRTSLFSSLRCTWDEIVRITIDRCRLIVSTPSTERSISVRKISNAQEAVDALNEAHQQYR
jgi:hypothetical protein